MKRRNFLKTSSSALATTALIGLPEIIRANNSYGQQEEEEQQVAYESILGTDQKVKGAKEYDIYLYPSAINSFDQSTESKKELDFWVDTYKNNQDSTINTYRFKIYKVKKQRGATTTFQIKAKYQSQTVGEDPIPNIFKKKLYFIIYMKEAYSDSYIELQNDDKEILAKLTSVKPTSSDTNTDCYITTACTVAKDLPDDCHELQTLREFRDNYIAQSSEGKKWVNIYYANAPNLVQRINKYPNSKEIYEYIYQNLVKRSVELVENKKYNKAFLFYRDCVVALDKMI